MSEFTPNQIRYTGDCAVPPKRLRDIPRALESLEKSVSTLDMVLGELMQRIGPVMRSEVAGVGQERLGKVQDGGITSLASSIVSQSDKLEAMSERIRMLAELIEL